MGGMRGGTAVYTGGTGTMGDSLGTSGAGDTGSKGGTGDSTSMHTLHWMCSCTEHINDEWIAFLVVHYLYTLHGGNNGSGEPLRGAKFSRSKSCLIRVKVALCVCTSLITNQVKVVLTSLF